MTRSNRRLGGDIPPDPDEPISKWEDVDPALRIKIEGVLRLYDPLIGTVRVSDEDQLRSSLFRLGTLGLGKAAPALVQHLAESATFSTVLDIDFRENRICGRVAVAFMEKLAENSFCFPTLQLVNLTSNGITGKALVAFLDKLAEQNGRFSALTELYLDDNGISYTMAKEAGFNPAEGDIIESEISDELTVTFIQKLIQNSDRLPALTTLGFSRNDFCDAKSVIELIEALRPGGKPGGNLIKIAVGGNPLKRPDGKAIEMAGLKIYPQPIEEVLAYLKEAIESKFDLREARVVLVGVGRNGKSQLAGALSEKLVPGEPTKGETLGFEVTNLHWNLPVTTDGLVVARQPPDKWHIRFFDMGGQPEQYSMHRLLFDRERNAMVFVCDGLKDWGWHGNRGDYFLKMIAWVGSLHQQRVTANAPPILAVVTRADQIDARHPLRTSPETIRDSAQRMNLSIDVVPEPVDALHHRHGLDLRRGLGSVEQAIQKAIGQITGTAISETFEPVRESLWARFGTYDAPVEALHTLSLESYIEDCIAVGAKNKAEAVGYLLVMHALGDVLYFENDELLNDRVINIHWARKAMYRLLTSPEVKSGNGIIDHIAWKRINAEDRTDTLESILSELRLIYTMNRVNVRTGASESVRLVPDMLGYAPNSYAWTERPTVCGVAFPGFLWEACMLQFIGEHCDLIDSDTCSPYRDQVVLKDRNGTRVAVRPDYVSTPMRIQFYADPSNLILSQAFCESLAGEMVRKYSDKDKGAELIMAKPVYPHPDAEEEKALEYILMGIGHYRKQQQLRMTSVYITLALAVLTVIATLLGDRWKALTYLLLVTASIAAFADLVIDRFFMEPSRAACARKFEFVDNILFEGQIDHYAEPEEVVYADIGRKIAGNVTVNNWYRGLKDQDDARVCKLLASWQEAEFRTSEHLYAVVSACVLMVMSLLVPCLIAWLSTNDRFKQIELGYLPFVPLFLIGLSSAIRNVQAWIAFRDVREKCKVEHNRTINCNSINWDEIYQTGGKLLHAINKLREGHSPVSHFVYRKKCNRSNEKIAQLAQLIKERKTVR